MAYNSTPKQIIRSALIIAIDSHRELIQSYFTKWTEDGSRMIVHPDNEETVSKLRRELNDFRKIYQRRYEAEEVFDDSQ